jgi:hypothetical protein
VSEQLMQLLTKMPWGRAVVCVERFKKQGKEVMKKQMTIDLTRILV